MTTYNVTDLAGIASALASASGGDEILLAAGSYGALSIDSVGFTSSVTLRSSDPENVAQLEQISILSSSYIRIEKVHVNRPTNGNDGTRLVNVDLSQNIQIVDCEINAPVDLIYFGYGIYVKDCDDVLINDNYIHDVNFGVAVFGGTGITVSENFVDFLGEDFLKIGGIVGFDIINNTGGGNLSPDVEAHPDFIQGQGGCSNGTISGNVWIAKSSGRAQGIFLAEGAYNNNLIEQNIIYTAKLQGIRIYEGTGNIVRNNTILAADSFSSVIATPTGTTRSNNIYTLHYAPGTNGTDLVVQNSNTGLANHYSELFVGWESGPLTLGEVTLADLVPIPGGAADGKGAYERLVEILAIDPPAPPPPAAGTTNMLLINGLPLLIGGRLVTLAAATAVNPSYALGAFTAGSGGEPDSVAVNGDYTGGDTVTAYFATSNSATPPTPAEMLAGSGGGIVQQVTVAPYEGAQADLAGFTDETGVTHLHAYFEEDNNGGKTTVSTTALTDIDFTAPTISNLTTNTAGDTISGTISESALIPDGQPATGDFTLAGVAAGSAIASVFVSGTSISLSIAANAAVNSDTITIAYTQGANTIQDSRGNPLASFGATSVTNAVPLTSAVTYLDGEAGSADFTAGTLDAGWSYVPAAYTGGTWDKWTIEPNPDGKNQLVWNFDAGEGADTGTLSASAGQNANRIERDIPAGDFVAHVMMAEIPHKYNDNKFAGYGFNIYGGGTSSRWEIYIDNATTGVKQPIAYVKVGGATLSTATLTPPGGGVSGYPMHMRISRVGTAWTFSVSYDGVSFVDVVASSDQPAFAPTKFGFYAYQFGGSSTFPFRAAINHIHIGEQRLPVAASEVVRTPIWTPALTDLSEITTDNLGGATVTASAGTLTLTTPAVDGAAARFEANAGVLPADVGMLMEYISTSSTSGMYAGAQLRSNSWRGVDWTTPYGPPLGWVSELQGSTDGTVQRALTINGDNPSVSDGAHWNFIAQRVGINAMALTKLRMEVIGPVYRQRIWRSVDPEPTTWDFEITDASVDAAGNFGLAWAKNIGNTAENGVLEVRSMELYGVTAGAAPGAFAPSFVTSGAVDLANATSGTVIASVSVVSGNKYVAAFSARGVTLTAAPSGMTLGAVAGTERLSINEGTPGDSHCTAIYEFVADTTGTVALAVSGSDGTGFQRSAAGVWDITGGQVKGVPTTQSAITGLSIAHDQALVSGEFLITGFGCRLATTLAFAGNGYTQRGTFPLSPAADRHFGFGDHAAVTTETRTISTTLSSATNVAGAAVVNCIIEETP